MAPQTGGSLKEIEAQLKDIVQNLFNLMVQGYDHQGPKTQEAIKREMASLVKNLMTLKQSAPSASVDIPPDIILYVESSRNPDVFTREFVELAQRGNQQLKGRAEAYHLFRDTLAKDIVAAMPELREDVTRICQSTGDELPT